ncbi:MAG: chorismate synthase, partial [Ruminococcus sp.]|nr:chorismate synthase [Ruminococcus sp.]
MKNTIGSSVALTIFGESHGTAIGAVLDGIAPGIPVDEEFIAHQMGLR